MLKITRRQRWMMILLTLTSGTLMQTSCNTIAADVVGGLATSVTNQFIRNVVFDALNAAGGGSGFRG